MEGLSSIASASVAEPPEELEGGVVDSEVVDREGGREMGVNTTPSWEGGVWGCGVMVGVGGCGATGAEPAWPLVVVEVVVLVVMGICVAGA